MNDNINIKKDNDNNTEKLSKFSLQHCRGNGTMLFLQQMNGLRRN